MRRLIVSGLLGLLPLPLLAQQMDMEAMAKWGAADVVRYHIVGVYLAQHHVASDGAGMAEIGDRVVIDLKWKLSEQKMVGTPTFQNTKTTVTKLRDREPSCLPPLLKGDLEYFDLQAVKEGLGGSLELWARTTYPVVEVAQSCTASRKAVPGKVEERPLEFTVVTPVMFAMPLPKSDDLAVTPDKKSFIVKKAGWTWTLTPSL